MVNSFGVLLCAHLAWLTEYYRAFSSYSNETSTIGWNFVLSDDISFQNLPPQACNAFVKGQYPRTISVQVEDRYGRRSNVVSRQINVITGTLVYGNARPVRVSNDQPLISLVFGRGRSTIDPGFFTNKANISAVDA